MSKSRIRKSTRKSRIRKSARKSRKSTLKCKCQQMVSSKIAINMREYKQGRFKSPKQAIAVAYSQVLKKSPNCKRVLKRK